MEKENKISVDQSQKNVDPLSDFLVFFKNDADFAFVFKKTEKLTTAVYMVTNLFSDNEPLKWTLRRHVSDLLSVVLGFKDIFQTEHPAFLNTVTSKVLEIVSLLEVASLSGLVSSMNFSILKQEFLNLIDSLHASQAVDKDAHKIAFPNTFFDVPHSKDSVVENPMVHDRVTAHLKDKESTANRQLDKQVEKRSNRQNVILNLLKKKGELTIKDISQVIKDCSEKTIQRELISFMSAGVIKRTGERRWSKYSLI